jgi:stage V sporulation protein S
MMTSFSEHDAFPSPQPRNPMNEHRGTDPFLNMEGDFQIDRDKPDVIKVSAKSRSTSVAGAIAAVIREHRYAEVQAIGAGAVNQAVKALAIARGYLQEDMIDILCIPYFTEVDIDGQERTAVRFVVEPRAPKA